MACSHSTARLTAQSLARRHMSLRPKVQKFKPVRPSICFGLEFGPHTQRFQTRFLHSGRRLLTWPRSSSSSVAVAVQDQEGWHDVDIRRLSHAARLCSHLLSKPVCAWLRWGHGTLFVPVPSVIAESKNHGVPDDATLRHGHDSFQHALLQCAALSIPRHMWAARSCHGGPISLHILFCSPTNVSFTRDICSHIHYVSSVCAAAEELLKLARRETPL